MTVTKWDVVIDGLQRLESPCVDLNGNLCFSDIAGDGAVYRLGSNGALEVIAARKNVGGLVPHADGGLVATGSAVVVIDQSGERSVMEPDGGWGFNDCATDAAGNLFVGMHGEAPKATPPAVAASAWRIGTDTVIKHCYGGIQLTNGMGVSPDGTRLYHNDTLPGLVWVSDLGADGMPSGLRPFHHLSDGLPDGMAIDEGGGVWVAAIGAGQVVRIAPDGRQDLVLEVGVPYVSALCFGGSDRRDLLVTTFGGPPYDLRHSGSVVTTRVDVAGAPVTPARV
jgi:xylono-1,5-lactonase